MAVAERPTGSYHSAERRHPRLVRRTAWLHRHSLGVAIAATALIAVIFILDARAAVDRRDPAARSGRWVARDALRELQSDKVLHRLHP